MLSRIIYSLSFKMVYIVYLGQKRGGGGRAPWAPPLNPPLLDQNLKWTVLIKLQFYDKPRIYLQAISQKCLFYRRKKERFRGLSYNWLR